MKPIEWDRVRAAIARFPVAGARPAGARRKASVDAEAAPDPDVPESRAPDPAADEPRFVEAIFASACEHLPAEILGAHVASLEAEVAALASARAGADGDALELAALEAAAHRIVSQAGTLGLMRLSARAAAVELACRTNDGIAVALARFGEAAPDLMEGGPGLPKAAA